MLKSKNTSNPKIKESRTSASNQFKIVVIGPPDAGTTDLIHRLLNKQSSQQTKRFKTYRCCINAKTLKWEEKDRHWQPSGKNKSCIRAEIFEVVATKSMLGLLHLLIAPQDIILVVYDPSSLSSPGYKADIDYILNSVSAHCSEAEECSTSSVHSPHFPVIFMVAISFISSFCLHIISFLRNYCHGKVYKRHISQENNDAFHFIPDRGMDSENKVNSLTKAILAAAQPLYGKHCPSVYSQFEKAISESRSLLRKVQDLEIVHQLDVGATEQVLKHFRNRGIILYYPKVQGLQNTILTSPVLIIYLIACICEPSIFDDPPLQETFLQIEDQLGVSVKVLLIHLLKKFNLALTDHWSITKLPKAAFYYDGTVFVIPSLIDAKIVPKKLKAEGYVGVLFYFPGGFLPQCVFYQLMVKLIDWFHSDGSTISW